MPDTDFFDEDLNTSRPAREPRPAPPPPDPVEQEALAVAASASAAAETQLAGMTRQKDEVERQVASASQEIDRLRKRQEDLERERRELEELRRKQEEYDRGRRELGDRLDQSLIMMEKEQLKAERLSELLQGTRDTFRSLLLEVRGIDDEAWEESNLREELNKALVILDEARMEYNKGLAKVESAITDETRGGSASQPLLPGTDEKPAWSFGFLLKLGLAISLPLLLTILAASVTFLVLSYLKLI